MTTTIQAYGKELVALAVPVIAWILDYVFKARAKLLLATPHAFTFFSTRAVTRRRR